MKSRHVFVTVLWIVGLLLAWRSGPWSAPQTSGSEGAESHDAAFHMHNPLHEGGKVSMVGQFHLELVSQNDGTHRLWISNAFRQEIDPAGFRGSVTLEAAEGSRSQAPFERVGRGKQLVAHSPPLEGQVWLTVNGRLGSVTRFDGVKFFWDYGPDAFRIDTPLGLDPMVPIPADNHPIAARVELGRRLFFDPALSADGSTSCASCHRPEYAFTEPRAIAQGIAGRVGRRNTPTVLNTAYLDSLFWDGRVRSLEEQALAPIFSHAEMGVRDEEAVCQRLALRYGRPTREAFGEALSTRTIARALSSFERTLLSGDSDFDRHEAGQNEALSGAARRGRSLFFGKAGCGNCHIPPLFTDFAFHNLGVGWRGARHGDRGRYEVTGDRDELGAFKTPSLRDATLTAPYMHDGSLATLREVIEFYNRGGNSNPRLDPVIKPLGLSSSEIDDLLALLRSLEGRSYDRRPHSQALVVGQSPDRPATGKQSPRYTRPGGE